MEKNQLPAVAKKRSNPLWEDISKFSRNKYGLAFLLVIVGLFGLIIPIIPGLLLILMAVALLKPGLMQKIRAKIKDLFK